MCILGESGSCDSTNWNKLRAETKNKTIYQILEYLRGLHTIK